MQHNTHFAELKAKHATPARAYIEYELSKTCIRVFALANCANERFKAASEMQGRINKYAELLISHDDLAAESAQELAILESESTSPAFFWNCYSNTLRFLGFKREFILQLASGDYRKRLAQQSQLLSWKNLERLMVAERRNSHLAGEPYSSIRLNELSARFGLIFVSIAKASITTPIIDTLFFSFEQLVSVVGCKDYEIGAHQFSYFIEMGKDTSNFDDFYKTQRIELNDFLNSGAFSHEWSHGIDNLLAPSFGESYSGFASDSRKQNPINLLVSTSKLTTLVFDDTQAELLINKSKSNIKRIMEFSNSTNGYTDYASFQKTVADELLLLSDKDWDKSSFSSRAMPYVRFGRLSLEVIISEMELIRTFIASNSIPLTQSVFATFAEILNSNYSYDYKGYWTEKREMFARAFEAYVDFQLTATSELPLVSLSFANWLPDSKETEAWLPQWNEVMSAIREKLAEVCATNRSEQTSSSEIVSLEDLTI
jgi:hypothetical protein